MATEEITVYFNPKCSKCRQAVALLDERDMQYQLRHYLDAPPDRAELARVLAAIGSDDPLTIMRTSESAFAENELAGQEYGRLLNAIVAHPVLLQRPIVVRGDRAVVARPPEKLLALLPANH